MKKTFPGYYRPDDDEFEKLWKNCLFVFDTNILLNLYRYSSETTNQFLGLLSDISNRIWLPHQAAYEYQKDRLEVIATEEKSYDDLTSSIDKTQKDLKNRLLSKRHPYLKDADEQIDKLGEIFDKIKSRLKEKRKEYVLLTEQDRIREKITSLFEGKVGAAYSETKFEEIYKEGKKRYDRKIPPGYMDTDKREPEIYGDLILWFQAIDKGKSEKKSIILIVDEKKEDWWLISKGKIIGPRPELIEEMLTETGLPFYMYRADPFMENVRKYLSKEITQQAIDEVKEVRERDEELLKEEMRLSDEVRAEIFRPSAPDLVDALKFDAMDYAMDSSHKAEELIKNMDAISRLKDAMGPSYKVTRILEAMDSSRAAKILEDMDYAEKIRNLAAHRPLSAEDVKNMNALNKMSKTMDSIRPTERKVESKKTQLENENEEKAEGTK